MNRVYRCDIKNMTLENYVKLFNEELYPKNYPYYLRIGIRTEDMKLSLIVQIGIPKEENLDSDDWDIDKPTEYDFQDILTIYGDSDEEIIKIFEQLEFHQDHKQYFRSLWKK